MSRKVLYRWLEWLRWPNLCIVALTQVLVQYALIERYVGYVELPFPHFLLFVFVTVLIAASGYVVNDLYDLPTDRINKPDKLWIGRHVRKAVAWRYYLGMVAVGAVIAAGLAAYVDALHLWGIYLLAVGSMFSYSKWLKGRPFWGNLLVALFTAFVVWIVWFANRHVLATFAERQPHTAAWLWAMVHGYCLFALLSTLMREMIKDLEDETGDRLAGLCTLPIVYGVAFAKKLTVVVGVVLALLLGFVAIWLFAERRWLAMGTAMGLAIWVLWLCEATFRAQKKTDFAAVSMELKLIMVVGLIAVLFL